MYACLLVYLTTPAECRTVVSICRTIHEWIGKDMEESCRGLMKTTKNVRIMCTYRLRVEPRTS
jgi:hypothetical protein